MTGFLSRLGRNRKQRTHIWSAVVVAAGTASRMEGIDKISPRWGTSRSWYIPCGSLRSVLTSPRWWWSPGRTCWWRSAACAGSLPWRRSPRWSWAAKSGSTPSRPDWRRCGRTPELIAIHDGARPLLPPEVLKEALDRGAATGAAAPAIPVTDTVKRAEGGVAQGDAGPLHPVCRPNASSVSGGPDPGCYPPGGGGGGGAHRRLRCGGAAGHEGLPHPGEPGKSQAGPPPLTWWWGRPFWTQERGENCDAAHWTRL